MRTGKATDGIVDRLRTVVYTALSSGPYFRLALSEGDEFKHSQNSVRHSITPSCQNRMPANDDRKTVWIHPCIGASDANNPSAEYRVPAVAMERQFRFVVNTRDNGFEPPHVHVWVCDEDVWRIELNGGTYIDCPPPCRRMASG